MKYWMALLVLVAAIGWTGGISAAEHATAIQAGHAEIDHTAQDTFPHPHISEDGSWAGVMVIVILLGFFLPAAVIGPIVRANTPEEVPVAHSHDEPPGSSGHHGHSGIPAEEPHH